MSPFLVRGLMLAGLVVAATVAGAMTEAKAQFRPVPKYCVRTYDGQTDCSYLHVAAMPGGHVGNWWRLRH